MKGDFTRFTHDPAKHYSGVLKQQGRVDIDADWNEYVQIQDYIDRTEMKDVIGRCGVPNSVPDGFKIVRAEGDNTKLEVLPGRIYVYGILCELAAKKGLPNPVGGKDGVYLAYLDVWQRHITAVEDPDLPEIALGGPDTTTRVKTEWQVRFEDVTSQVDAEHLECKPFCCSKDPWIPKGAASTGKLGARPAIAEPTTEICEVPAEAGYRGLQNRLYRVEVHAGSASSKLTFKWSRDNGSVVFPITIDKVEGNSSQGYKSRIILKQPGKDADLSLHVNDWVEVSGEQTELDCAAGTMAQVASESDGTNINKGIIVLKADLSKYVGQSYPKVRRWDQKEATGVTLVDGAVPVTFDKWVALEDGVEVCFKSGTYQPGDYWMIPARTRTPHVLWDGPEFQDRHGTQHYYCALALIKLAGGVWDEPVDCRHIFPPLTEVKRGGCCITVREGENVQQAIDTVVAAGGGCVCLCRGLHEITGPLKIHRAHNLCLHGDGPGTILHVHGVDNDGISGIWVHAMPGCGHRQHGRAGRCRPGSDVDNDRRGVQDNPRDYASRPDPVQSQSVRRSQGQFLRHPSGRCPGRGHRGLPPDRRDRHRVALRRQTAGAPHARDGHQGLVAPGLRRRRLRSPNGKREHTVPQVRHLVPQERALASERMLDYLLAV